MSKFSQFNLPTDRTGGPVGDVGAGSFWSSLAAALSPMAAIMVVAALLAGVLASILFWWRYPLAAMKGTAEIKEWRVIRKGRRFAWGIGLVFGLLIAAGAIVILWEKW